MDCPARFIDACSQDGQKVEKLIRNVYRQLPNRRVFIDGGAHRGYHAYYASRFYSGRVIAVEASPKTFVHLIKARTRTPGGAGECEVIPVSAALGSRARQGDTVDFFHSPSHPGRSTTNTQMWEQWGEGSVTYDAPVVAPIVEIDDLAALLAGGRPVDFIKLDLEGNEINALRGATKTLQAHRPVIVTEFGLKPDNEHLYDETLTGFAGLLDQWGYRAFAPWGEDVTASMVEEYPFWYLFLLPIGETLDTQRQLLEDAFATSLGE